MKWLTRLLLSSTLNAQQLMDESRLPFLRSAHPAATGRPTEPGVRLTWVVPARGGGTGRDASTVQMVLRAPRAL